MYKYIMRRHGWGIKSIKYTADRYDGATYINADNNRFDVKIAIPKKLTVYRLYEKENTQDESCVFSYFEKNIWFVRVVVRLRFQYCPQQSKGCFFDCEFFLSEQCPSNTVCVFAVCKHGNLVGICG